MTVQGIDRDLLRFAFLILDLMGRLVPEMRADMLERLQQHSNHIAAIQEVKDKGLGIIREF
jgi:hypothetical protein